jgi:serine protease Do
MKRIVIRHLSGSKAKKVEEFPLDNFEVLIFGRGEDSSVRYDPDKDDLISRQHAKMSRSDDEEDSFVLSDMNSRNGTYINKQRIYGPTSIIPGDIVQLGPGGPQFEFDLNPRPNPVIKATREVPQPTIKPTREVGTSAASSAQSSLPTSKTYIGKATVEHMIGSVQQSSRKSQVNLAAAILGAIVLVAGVMIYLILGTRDTIDKQLQIAQEEISEKKEQLTQSMHAKQAVLNPEKIFEKYSDATVYIKVRWRLIYRATNEQVFHHYEDGGKYPSYILDGNNVYPWLTLKDENRTNKPISGILTGSGFVMSSNGFILTCRHVVAPWDTKWDELPRKASKVFSTDKYEDEKGKWLTKVLNKGDLLKEESDRLEIFLKNIGSWIPINENRIVKGKRWQYYVETPEAPFEGRSTIDVTFPNNNLSIPARIVRISNRHDVALIKVNAPDPLKIVEVHDYKPQPGADITILGYPSSSPPVYVVAKSQDVFHPESIPNFVPRPTLASGNIGRLLMPKSDKEFELNPDDYISAFGDLYQLTANVGSGTSGGPVFDTHGHVIAIFNAWNRLGGTFAVPIEYGLEIMGRKKVID